MAVLRPVRVASPLLFALRLEPPPEISMMNAAAHKPVAAAVARTPFHVLLRKERESCGCSVHEAATRATVRRAEYETWEAGTALPTPMHMKRIFGQKHSWRMVDLLREEIEVRRLAAVRPPAPPALSPPPIAGYQRVAVRQVEHSRAVVGPKAASTTSVTFPEVKQETIAAETPIEPAQTFGANLRHERIKAKFSLAELGQLITPPVVENSVSQWELDRTAPISAHLDQLLDLFPDLRKGPMPPSRDIPKPNPGPVLNRTIRGAFTAQPALLIDHPVPSIPPLVREPEPPPVVIPAERLTFAAPAPPAAPPAPAPPPIPAAPALPDLSSVDAVLAIANKLFCKPGMPTHVLGFQRAPDGSALASLSLSSRTKTMTESAGTFAEALAKLQEKLREEVRRRREELTKLEEDFG
jgi:hypothetical protein